MGRREGVVGHAVLSTDHDRQEEKANISETLTLYSHCWDVAAIVLCGVHFLAMI
jgi:hypothetical protein